MSLPKVSSRAAALAFSAVIAAACSASKSTTTTAPTPGGLGLDTLTLDFGIAAAGSTVTKGVVVTNTGETAVAVTGVTVMGDTRNAFSVLSAPKSVDPALHATIDVVYTGPATAGTDTATLVIAQANQTTPTLTVALTARSSTASCSDKAKNGTESDVDCGGSCTPCAAGRVCGAATDCTLGLGCLSGKCGTCAADGDCAKGAFCRGGMCVGCTSDNMCPAGATCEMGQCKTCPGAVGRLDTQTDPANCGRCGNACPKPLNAGAACHAGACGRANCAPGFFDFDGAKTFGCEAKCQGVTCTAGDGSQLTLTFPPVPEGGSTMLGASNGGSWAASAQANTKFTNVGVVGESPSAASSTQQNAKFINQGGFRSALGK